MCNIVFLLFMNTSTIGEFYDFLDLYYYNSWEFLRKPLPTDFF